MNKMRLLCLLLTATAAVQAADEICPIEDVHPGMKGYGLTVFRGVKIERFDVEVIDVLPKADLDGDWIMIKILSGPVVERGTGVVGGMSGSPVYLEGRLAGAVAYGFFWPLEPICFLTPIENMLRVLDAADEERPNSRLATRTVPLPRPVTVAGRQRRRVLISERPLPPGYQPPPDVLAVEPLMTPLMVSGLGPMGIAALNDVLAPYHLSALQVPAGSRSDVQADLVPGAALGVPLVTGDVSATGVGTVTYRRGDQILGFGHPMMQRNRVALPICGAYVLDIFASRQRSFKLSATLPTVGTLDEDGHWGIACRIGDPPPMIPLTVTINDLDRGLTKTISCQIVDDPDLAPQLALGIAQDVVGTWLGLLPRAMVSTRTTVELKGYPAVVRQEVGVVDGQVQPAAVADLLATLQLAIGNTFEKLSVASIELSIDVRRGDDTASILRAYVDKSVVEPGDTINVELDLRRRRDGQTVRRTISISVPTDAPSGKTRLAVIGGVGEPGLAALLKLLTRPPETLSQLLEQFAETDTNNRSLVAKLALPQTDLAVRGELFAVPPAQVADLLAQAGTTDLARGQAALRVEEPIDLVVLNGAIAPITIAQPGQTGGNGQPKKNSVEIIPGLPASPLAEPLASYYTVPEWVAMASGPRRRARATNAAATPSGKPGGEARPNQQPKPGEGKKDKGINSRATRQFTHNTAKDFLGGEIEGTTVIAEGSVVLGLGSEVLARANEPILWAAAVDADGIAYLGSGNNGELLRLPPGGELEVAYRSPHPAVTAVACASDGVYFATAPDGVIRRLGSDGQAVEVAATGSSYVWKLLAARDGGVLAATGEPAQLLRLKDGQVEVLHRVPRGHFLCLAEGPDGAVYLGAEPGRVVRLRNGEADTLLITESPVHAVAVTGDGTLFYGDGSAIGRLRPDGSLERFHNMAGTAILDLEPTSYGLLVALRDKTAPATGSVWIVDPETAKRRRAFLPEALAVTDLVPFGEDHYLAATSCPAIAYRLTLPYAAEGTYESAILDADAGATWGTVEVQSKVPEGGRVVVETRSGNTPEAGDDWSAWVVAERRVNSPRGRYLQYRLTLGSGDGQTPVVKSVRIHYGLLNVAPTVSLETPSLGDAWRGKQTIKWKVEDVNGDRPLLNLALAPADSDEWTELASELDAQGGKYEIDTAKQEDGRYRLKLVADDSVYNPDDPKTTELVSDMFLIDNTPPEIVLPGDQHFELTADGRLELTATAEDQLLLDGVEWRFDDDPWRPVVPYDGLFDSALELVQIRTTKVTGGKHTLEIRARDAAGNEATVKREIEGPPKPAE